MECPQWIDIAFVQKAFEESGQKNVRVDEISVFRATADGENYMSQIYRVSLKLSGGEKRSVIVKCPLKGGHVESHARKMGFYQNEAHMYSEVLPVMEEMLESCATGRFPPFAPRCLRVAGDVLVMQDLAQEGYRLADKQKGQNFDHALLALQALARFHGVSVLLLERNPELLKPLKNPRDATDIESFVRTVRDNINEMAREVRCWKDFAQAERLAKNLELAAPKVFDRCKDVFNSKEALNVLGHNDFWTNNMLFRYEDDKPKDVRFIDMQLSSVASVAGDLLAFRHTSLEEDAWRRWPALLRAYHEQLALVLGALGGPPAPSLERVLGELHRCRSWGLMAIAIWMHVTRADPGRKYEMDDAYEGKGNFKALMSDEYRRWLRLLVLHFDETGVFDDILN